MAAGVRPRGAAKWCASAISISCHCGDGVRPLGSRRMTPRGARFTDVRNCVRAILTVSLSVTTQNPNGHHVAQGTVFATCWQQVNVDFICSHWYTYRFCVWQGHHQSQLAKQAVLNMLQSMIGVSPHCNSQCCLSRNCSCSHLHQSLCIGIACYYSVVP